MIYLVNVNDNPVAAYTDPLLAEQYAKVYRDYDRFANLEVKALSLDPALPVIRVTWTTKVDLEKDSKWNQDYQIRERLFFKDEHAWVADWLDPNNTVVGISTTLGRDHLKELVQRALDGENICGSDVPRCTVPDDEPAGDSGVRGGGCNEDYPRILQNLDQR